MGRHSNVLAPLAPVTPVRAAVSRPRSRGRIPLFCFGFLAAIGIMLVNVVDPYSGATASPYFQIAPRFQAHEAQSVVVASGYEHTVTRETYTVTDPPPPPPPPVVVEEEPAASVFRVPPSVVPDPGSAQEYAHGAVMARGWGEDEFSCLVALWSKESGWRVNAGNESSGAYGIPQALPGSKMATAGPDWETNAGTQIEWGLGYITGRYGSPCGAWAHSEAEGWY